MSSLPGIKGPTGAARAAEERESTARFEARTEAAEARRRKVAQRNAARAASGQEAAPLPPPLPGSAPTR